MDTAHDLNAVIKRLDALEETQTDINKRVGNILEEMSRIIEILASEVKILRAF